MEKLSKLMALALAAGVLAVPAVAPAAAPDTKDSSPCFFVSQWKTWKAVDDNTILLRVNRNDIYRVGVTGGADHLRGPGTFLVSESHGNSICSHMDLQFSASDTATRMKVPLIARSLVKLSAAEVASIPAKDLPGR